MKKLLKWLFTVPEGEVQDMTVFPPIVHIVLVIICLAVILGLYLRFGG